MHGKTVLVVGLGRRGGGVGVAKWAAAQGAEVVVTDSASREALTDSIAELSDFPTVQFVLGGHDEVDVATADLVVRNPAVRSDSDLLVQARELGVPVAMELGLYLRSTKASLIGVTGSKGKTTTSFAIHHLLDGSFPRVEIAGNMGISALDQPALAQDEIGVLEISSFQAEGMAEFRVAPHVFVVTNLLEDHLDRYPTVDHYHEAKMAVLDHQRRDDWAVLPSRIDERIRLDGRARGRRLYFEAEGEPLPPGADGVFTVDGSVRAIRAGREIELLPVSDLPLSGDHNVSNLAAAIGAALAVGIDPAAIGHRLASFQGLEHRQMSVATIDGVEYVNDSAATMPAATAASLRTYTNRDIVLIAGGSSKKLNPHPLATAVAELARTVVLLEGDATGGIRNSLTTLGFDALQGPLDSMEAAVMAAASIARPGSIVLLAPGATSFGMFADEFDRGEKFKDAVLSLKKSRAI